MLAEKVFKNSRFRFPFVATITIAIGLACVSTVDDCYLSGLRYVEKTPYIVKIGDGEFENFIEQMSSISNIDSTSLRIASLATVDYRGNRIINRLEMCGKSVRIVAINATSKNEYDIFVWRKQISNRQYFLKTREYFSRMQESGMTELR